MATNASQREDNEAYKFGGTQPNQIFVKTSLTDSNGDAIDSSNPLPVDNEAGISNDLEGKGSVTVGTTAVELTFTGTTEVILIQSDDSNTGIIYVGKSDVDSSGNNALVKLQPGWYIKMDYDDSTNAIYVVSDTASQSVIAGALK